MGISNRRELSEFLMLRGWKPETPTALILGASRPQARTWVTKLDELDQIPLPPTNLPGTLVIGEVVSLAEHIAIENPLFFTLEKGIPV
jgi:siroheme synthase